MLKLKSTLQRIALLTFSIFPEISSANDYSVNRVEDCSSFSSSDIDCNTHRDAFDFIIKWNDLVNIHREYLTIKSMTKNGQDIRKNITSMSSYPKQSRSGNYEVRYRLHVKDYSYLDGDVRLTASFKVLVGNSLKTVVDTVDLSKPFKHDMGSYTVTNAHRKPYNVPLLNIIPNAFIQAFPNLFFTNLFVPDNDEESLILVLVGNIKNIINLSIDDNGRDISPSSTSWKDDQQILSYKKPGQPKVDLKLTFWDRIEWKEISFSL